MTNAEFESNELLKDALDFYATHLEKIANRRATSKAVKEHCRELAAACRKRLTDGEAK